MVAWLFLYHTRTQGSNADEGSTFLNDEVYSREQFQAWCMHMFGNTTGAKVFALYSSEEMLNPKPDPDLQPSGGKTWNNAATEILGPSVASFPRSIY